MQTENAENQPSDETSASRTPGANDLRVARTTGRICQAVITCLDEVGYAETSINRVQSLAGVSRGALTHHFPSKEAMMVETLERLLDPVRGQPNPKNPSARPFGQSEGQGDGIDADLPRLWAKVVNTKEGRALIELLVAARTHSELAERIRPSLHAYNAEIGLNIQRLYSSADGSGEVTTLWTICRAFLRGLQLQQQFESDPRAVDEAIATFGKILAPHLFALKPGTNDK